MSVIITEVAAAEIKKAIEAQNKTTEDLLLRIKVVGGGCSGLQYGLGLDEDANASEDSVSEQHGVRVVVDKKSELFLDGTKVDYYEDLNRRGFVFDNPNAVKSCGCGSSFSA